MDKEETAEFIVRELEKLFHYDYNAISGFIIGFIAGISTEDHYKRMKVLIKEFNESKFAGDR